MIEHLVDAILKQAILDYTEAMTVLKHQEDYERTKVFAAERLLADCEIFFKSQWFEQLTGVNSEYAFKAIKERVLSEI